MKQTREPPEEIRCKSCAGWGDFFGTDDELYPCYPCSSTGVDVGLFIIWLANPKNDPTKYRCRHYNGSHEHIGLDELAYRIFLPRKEIIEESI